MLRTLSVSTGQLWPGASENITRLFANRVGVFLTICISSVVYVSVCVYVCVWVPCVCIHVCPEHTTNPDLISTAWAVTGARIYDIHL